MRIIFPMKEIEDVNLGIMYLSRVLQQRGHTVEVIEAEYEPVAAALRKKTPTILAFSTLAFYADYYIALNRRLKETHDVFSIFGGSHPTGTPEMIEEEGVDAVCRGEGEDAFAELADGLDRRQNITAIRNMWIKDGAVIHKNEMRPLVKNLDEIPFPDREVFKRQAPFFYERINIITSRGCLFSCPYCYNNTLARVYAAEKSRYRRRSVDNVLQEIRLEKEQRPVRFILFHDDIFILMPGWLKEFSPRYRKEIGIPFSCYIRIDLITPEIVSYLKQAGCHSVCFGLETGNDEVRAQVLRRKMSKEQIIQAAALLKKSGIRLRTTNMIGLPGGSLAGDLETLRLNIACKVDYAHVTMLSAYPNTDMAEAVNGSVRGWAHYSPSHPSRLLRFLKKYSLSAVGYYQRLAFSFQYPRYGYADAAERGKIANLHNLFGVIVGFPFLSPFVNTLIAFPRNMVFTYANFFWRHYCAYFRIYSAGWRSAMRGVMKHRRHMRSDMRMHEEM